MAMDASNTTTTTTTTTEEFEVGCSIAIKTTLGDEFEGQIITFDKSANVLVLQEVGPTHRKNIRILKANYIKEFAVIGHGEDPLDPKQCYMDLATIQHRELAAISQAEIEAHKEAQKEVQRIGVGVTPDAQKIFDALSKTLPVHWDKTSIVVLGEVRVNSPYLPENVIGGSSAANGRVKKMIERLRGQ